MVNGAFLGGGRTRSRTTITVGVQGRMSNLPTYPGVPQAVDMTSPLPSILERPKSLIIIFDSSWGLKYSRFSGWRKETQREKERIFSF